MTAIRETQHAFGRTALDPAGAQVVGGPALDDATRRDMQFRGFPRPGQARRPGDRVLSAAVGD